MLRRSLTGATARASAAILALALSGAPRIAALHAPPEAHHCACPAGKDGHHECSCALCRRAALAAKSSNDALPPCHRAAALDALTAADGASREVPCIEGTCGNEDGHGLTVPGGHPFCLPVVKSLVHLIRVERRTPSVRSLSGLAQEPPTPPPRVA